jgi:hypothetical protein
MASTISTVAKWSTESAGADTGQSGDLERPHPRSRAETSPSTQARELVWLDDVRRSYSIKEIARREGLGESSTVCPEPANEGTYPVYVNPIPAMRCTNGTERLKQVREE